MSVSKFHQGIFLNFPHVSSQPIKSECLKISSRYFLKFSARFLAANEKRVSQNFIKVCFNFSARFLAAKQMRVSQNFIEVFFNFSARFFAANQKRVSQNFIKVFLNVPYVSSQTMKSECLRISSRYFLISRTFPRSQANSSVPEFHQSFFFNFSARFLAANEKRVSQNFIKVYFKLSAPFLAANQK